MNPTRRIMLAGMKGMILLLVLAVASCAPAPATRTSTTIPQATKQQVLVAYGKLPLIFEANQGRSEEHTSELQSQSNLVCRLLLEKKKQKKRRRHERYS